MSVGVFLQVLLCIAVAGILGWLTYHGVFWRAHDQYDDSGYMLAIFKQLHAGHMLYREVFSQYGPFHGQAWLAFFGATGLPVDHDGMGWGVMTLWLGTALLAGTVALRITQSRIAASLAAFWAAWTLRALANELGHPVSLCAFLAMACVALYQPVRGRWSFISLVGAGAGVAALVLTKINLGLFQGAALTVALVLTWMPSKRLAVLLLAPLAIAPWVIVGPAWPLEPRLLLCIAVLLATGMVVAASPGAAPARWRSELAALALGFLVAGAAIVAHAMWTGLRVEDLVQGVLIRPLELPAVFVNEPVTTPLDYTLAGTAAAMAFAWWRWVRPKPCLPAAWMVAVGLAGFAALAVLLFHPTFSAGVLALMWLPATVPHASVQDESSVARYRLTTLVCLTAAWHALGVFPVSGSQSCIPYALAATGWISILLLQPGWTHALKKSLLLRLNPAACLVIAATGWHFIDIHHDITSRRERHRRFNAEGTEKFRLPMEQEALITSVLANLRQTQGPLYTSHGQNSLSLWSNKPFVTGYNCTFTAGILSEKEIDAVHAGFVHAREWSCVVYQDGLTFGQGPHQGKIASFVQQHTYPWLQIGDYELRLSHSHPPVEPVATLWQEGSHWKLRTSGTKAVLKAKKWRLRSSRQFASGRWTVAPEQLAEMQASLDSGGDTPVLITLPEPLAQALNEATPDQRYTATLWLCDMRWNPLDSATVAKRIPPQS